LNSYLPSRERETEYHVRYALACRETAKRLTIDLVNYAQGWGAVHDLTNDPEDAQIAFAAADWVISQQLERNGACLEDMSPDEPSFNTGFIAEGVAGAWRAAVAQNDRDAKNGRTRVSWIPRFG
jgi:hypothetical protein